MPGDTTASQTLPEPRQPGGPYRVCLVCLGNICRSPMAEAVLRRELAAAGLAEAVAVESAGTGDWHVGERMFRPAWAELEQRGYDASTHRARQIQPEWLADYDLVVAMDRANLADLRRMAADDDTLRRIRLLREFDPGLRAGDPYRGEVPDPFGDGPDAYGLAFDLVLAAVTGLTDRLAGLLGSPAPHR